MNAVVDGLRLAVGTLTMVPVGELDPPTRRSAAWGMSLAPLAALPLAVAAAATCGVAQLTVLPPLVGAALALVVLALGSRAMHLDGLADTVDGVGAGWSRERALEVMRRGDVGPMGVTALVLVLLAQAAAAAAVLGRPWGWLLVGVAVLVSRAACVLTCTAGIRAARPDGLGAVVAEAVPRAVTVVVLLVTAGLLSLAVGVQGTQPLVGIVAVLAMTAVVAALVRTATRVFGGVSGDVMGAAIELSFATLLVVLSSGLGR
jgi:adenosylcobinamide-GDP ribazoletransferase